MPLLAAAVAVALLPKMSDTLTGLDVLVQDGFIALRGKRVGLITNQTGIDREGRRGIDVMRAAGVKIGALFSPEHGFGGTEDRQGIGDATDAATGLPIFSLYGKTQRPTPESLRGIDVLVFDIADVGVRFYTYETTMAYGMEAAAAAKIPYIVLDRPNPVTGTRVEGPLLGAANTSFAGYHPSTPARHGMTMGELARMFNAEHFIDGRKIGADLVVVPMQNWRRGDWFDDTGLPWINPSPNMRSLKAAILYPGVCLVEFAPNLSVGRGTDAPFEQIGADWIDGRRLARELNGRNLPGLRFYAITFTPTESRFAKTLIQGVRIEITDREKVPSVRLGIEIACALQRLYPGKMNWSPGKKLIGSDDTVRRIAAGESPETIERGLQGPLDSFRGIRGKYLLYR